MEVFGWMCALLVHRPAAQLTFDASPYWIRYNITSDVRLVLDPDVIVAAMRSTSGASAAILRAARAGTATLLLSVPLAMEYEAVCRAAEHRLAAPMDDRQIGIFIDAIIAMSEPVETHFLWRPQLRDPNDEMVLEAAVNGRVDALVTFNVRHFGDAPKRFGIDLLLPSAAIRRIRA
jgi:predicted nucleic acid-binding protein